ncbi:1-deoxy-D-xylulose-5-phosphate reductoisomerase [Alteribacter natronophilus]|uniref:1-deoxy-D-xylulose-5-phosphate reductoisomerase n=1 Tax=Alteribacter natronophilus TaxID=2583810 RepID=UPI00110DF851|nr:1-deoxy-D-xylulose-5-phosphate reductoisomerase [Alteribacter natronophilus]TMW73240.1 1-deoxy-D-xylulose-5-phosphate reductoisomerase [Alteribacter natronophilus]
MKKIILLGSTGSIGVQTLEVIEAHPDRFRVEALTCGKNIKLAAEQIRMFGPSFVSTGSKEDASRLQEMIPSHIEVGYGEEGLLEAVRRSGDIIVNALMGSVGLNPTLEGMKTGKDVALANKETLVTAGHIVTEQAEQSGVKLIPVDSEHSAIYQCLEGNRAEDADRLILTASGGSFRDLSRNELSDVTVEDALKHPNWSMGAKITIDSATMMNKGLEVIEARWLFDIPYERIDVILHKESMIHSMVEYIDGSVLAHLGTPDMKVPIQYALSLPARHEVPGRKRLDLWEIGKLHFEKPDLDRFRCLKMAYDAGRAGGTAPAVMNAANEVAVEAFLNRQISFLEIEDLIDEALQHHSVQASPDLETIIETDRLTRAGIKKDLNKRL